MEDLAEFTVLPYLLQGAVGLSAGAIADAWIAGGMSVRKCRQVMQAAGMIIPAFALGATATQAHSAEDAVALLTIGMGASALTLAGVSVNHLDIAPRNAGVVFGIGNTAGTVGGFISVGFCGWLEQITGSWPAVLGVIGAHGLVGAAFWWEWLGSDDIFESVQRKDVDTGSTSPDDTPRRHAPDR